MMEEQNEKNRRKVAISIEKANIFALVIMVVAGIVLAVPFFLIWGNKLSAEEIMNSATWIGFFIAMLAGVVVHELIHGITWAFFAPSGWRSISFGVLWKLLTPYCHCDEPMRISAYMWGAMMPCIVLGVVPGLLSLCTGSLVLLLWGIIFIAAAAGDIWMTWLLTKEKPDSLVLDHPSEAGFYVYDAD